MLAFTAARSLGVFGAAPVGWHAGRRWCRRRSSSTIALPPSARPSRPTPSPWPLPLPPLQAKVEHTLAWTARHRMPVEVVRLEDVQPPEGQVVLVRRLAAKYDLPLAPRAPGGGADGGGGGGEGQAQGGADGVLPILYDARQWIKKPFVLRKHLTE